MSLLYNQNILHAIVDIELKFVSSIGDKNFVLILLIVGLALTLYRFRHKLEAKLLVISSLSFIVADVLKTIFKHTRPITAQHYIGWNAYSFPSGHVLIYTAVFGYVLYLTVKLKKLDKFVRAFLQFISLYFLSLVGISRVYLGQHFVKDVVAGYIFGVIYLGFIIWLDKKWSDKSTNSNNSLAKKQP